MQIVDPREVAWLSVEVSTCDEKGDVTMKLRFRLRRQNSMAGLTLAYGPLLVDRREKSPYSGRWAVAATAAKVSQQGKACLEGRRFLPGAPLTIRSSPRAPPTP
jgi:hypothetical protein